MLVEGYYRYKKDDNNNLVRLEKSNLPDMFWVHDSMKTDAYHNPRLPMEYLEDYEFLGTDYSDEKVQDCLREYKVSLGVKL